MTNFLITAGFLCTLAVTIVQVVITPWHRSMTGRSIFGLLAMLNVIIGLSAARVWFGDYPFRQEIIMVSFTLLIVAVLFIGATIVREQLRGARDGRTP
jgi:ABC-type antimicrobial peptide transport system permease subunit